MQRAVIPVCAAAASAALLLLGCGAAHFLAPTPFPNRPGRPTAPQEPDPLALITPPRTVADRIVNRAKQEVLRRVSYDADYRRINYPNGDLPPDRGACSDVVVRSLRAGGYDLQRLIHEDMEQHYDRYPHHWDIHHPDSNIDHRRGINHIAFFRRHAQALPTEVTGKAAAIWQPGDLVYWKLGNNLDHCGVVSNVRGAQGIPLVIHNIGQARQEDCLTAWKIIAHFRYPTNNPRTHQRSRARRHRS